MKIRISRERVLPVRHAIRVCTSKGIGQEGQRLAGAVVQLRLEQLAVGAACLGGDDLDAAQIVRGHHSIGRPDGRRGSPQGILRDS
ncbi:hypothetical protein [Streptomyces sp. NPDC059874]|uniref:hypothetical protein n=1 Tax=Streptomyces sp. NPDC059874 TaxID=3346983 RepID=UPI00365DB938